MNFGNKILSLFGYGNKPTGIQFMSYMGDCETPGFHISFDKLPGIRQAYCRCSPVSTVVNRLASSMANGKWWVTDKNNNDVSEKYPNIYNLIKKQNPLQTGTEFIKQIDTYRNLYGITFVWAVVPEGYGSIEDAVSLWPVNPEKIEPVCNVSKGD
jgi:hypothetical protein